MESALWVARKLQRQRKHSQSSLLSQPSSKDTCDLIVLEHFTNRPRSPGTCTSPHCAHCCPRFLQRCTWHLVSQQQRGRVSHWASEGGIARGDSTSELNKSLGVRSIFCSFKMCHSRSISKCVQSVFLSGKPTSDNKERIKMERTHLWHHRPLLSVWFAPRYPSWDGSPPRSGSLHRSSAAHLAECCPPHLRKHRGGGRRQPSCGRSASGEAAGSPAASVRSGCASTWEHVVTVSPFHDNYRTREAGVCVWFTHMWPLNSNWKRLLVILAPLWPENTNILSLHTATGKLQQDGGISPLWSICGKHRQRS